jgi:transposase
VWSRARRCQSGSSIDVQGRISKAGDGDVRRVLYEAASALLTRFKRMDKAKIWRLAIARRCSHREACGSTSRFYCGDRTATAVDVRAHAAVSKLLRRYA